jgi:hypothetical protein
VSYRTNGPCTDTDRDTSVGIATSRTPAKANAKAEWALLPDVCTVFACDRRPDSESKSVIAQVSNREFVTETATSEPTRTDKPHPTPFGPSTSTRDVHGTGIL